MCKTFLVLISDYSIRREQAKSSKVEEQGKQTDEDSLKFSETETFF